MCNADPIEVRVTDPISAFEAHASAGESLTVLFSHPSAEMYGSDRMVLETVRSFVSVGHSVAIVLPTTGSLVGQLEDAGAEVIIFAAPVIRKSALNPVGFVKLVADVLASMPKILTIIRRARPDVVYVNTIVQPWWIFGGRLSRKRVLVHVREAERDAHRLVRALLLFPLRAAHLIVANSRATSDQLAVDARGVSDRTIVVYNGKDWSSHECGPAIPHEGPFKVLFVGRLNTRKGPDIAIGAIALLVERGYDATLDIAGAVFPGYEWFESELRDRVEELGLVDRVAFHGFIPDPIDLLRDSDALAVPSRVEPFGTVAAEGLAASRPVVVADVQGLVEIVTHLETGLVVAPDNAEELATALATLIDDPSLRLRLAQAGSADVRARFSQERYSRDMLRAVEDVVSSSARGNGKK